jgi:hypothetical protein
MSIQPIAVHLPLDDEEFEIARNMLNPVWELLNQSPIIRSDDEFRFNRHKKERFFVFTTTFDKANALAMFLFHVFNETTTIIFISLMKDDDKHYLQIE